MTLTRYTEKLRICVNSEVTPAPAPASSLARRPFLLLKTFFSTERSALLKMSLPALKPDNAGKLDLRIAPKQGRKHGSSQVKKAGGVKGWGAVPGIAAFMIDYKLVDQAQSHRDENGGKIMAGKKS